MAPNETFRPHERIKDPADFRRAFDRKRSVSDDVLIVYGVENGLDHPRLGISVSRKKVPPGHGPQPDQAAHSRGLPPGQGRAAAGRRPGRPAARRRPDLRLGPAIADGARARPLTPPEGATSAIQSSGRREAMTTDVPRTWLSWPGRILIALLIGLIRVYQATLSPLLGNVCRFEPSCSRYMVESLKTYGLVRGLARGLRRLSRCHPWNPGGYDPP